MLHGSLSGPEAVLSARQTEMFLGLRDALSNMSSGENKNNNNLVIENITINTKSMDSKQDFNSAGQELAKAFSNAINKNGLTLNTKKIGGRKNMADKYLSFKFGDKHLNDSTWNGFISREDLNIDIPSAPEFDDEYSEWDLVLRIIF